MVFVRPMFRLWMWLLNNYNKTTCHWPWRNLRNLKIGKGVIFGRGGSVMLDNERSVLTIGDHTAIGDDFHFVADAPISIGSECLLSWNVTIVSHVHCLGATGVRPHDLSHEHSRPITIGNRCHIGCNVVIISGTKIGDGCTIMANSVVKGEFPDNSIIGHDKAALLRTHQI